MKYVESINNSLSKLLEDDDRVFILGEDIVDPYGGAFKVTKGLSTKFPGRLIPMPISEQSMMGVCTGMAASGLLPIMEVMFGDFISLCMDQILNSATKMEWMYNGQVKTPIVIRTPMGGRRGYGPTHSQTLESLFMTVPNINIIAPSRYHDVGNMLYSTVLNNDKLILFVENKTLYPQDLVFGDVLDNFSGSRISEIASKSNLHQVKAVSFLDEEKPDVTIISYGGMVDLVIEAAKEAFMEEEVLSEVLIYSLVKPIDIVPIKNSISQSGKVLIVEEGVRNSGWSAEMASSIYSEYYEYLNKPISRIGAKEYPIPSSVGLEKLVLPQVGDIKNQIFKLAAL